MNEPVSREEYKGRTALIDERFVEINKRQNKLEDAFELSTKLDVKLSLLVDQLRKEQDKADERLCSLEQKPGKRWEAFAMGVLLAGVGGVIGYLLK